MNKRKKMKKQKAIALPLAFAASTLLGHALPVQAQEATPGWEFDSALLIYNEPGRVSAVEPVVSAKRTTQAGSILTLKGAIDVLTGASGTGAVPTDRAQTFTRPSGNDTYTIAPGETPLDDTFKDTRLAINADWEAAISRTLRYGLGLNFSTEYDYRSIGVSGRFLKDFNQKNTTVSIGMSQAQDSIEPVGGVPEALQLQSAANYNTRQSGDDKSVTDVLIGVTQIIDQKSFFQINYGLTSSSGYHNDPYKLISIVNSEGRPFAGGGNVPSVVYENRPDSRTRHSVYGRYRRLLNTGNILDLSYRFANDDWGITSHTIDSKYRFVLNKRRYLQFRFRYYLQGEADFYTPFAREGESLGEFASADYRLAQMNAFTLGVEYGFGKPSREWRVGLEYYLQQPKEPGNKFGELNNQELAPAVSAIMFRVNKSF